MRKLFFIGVYILISINIAAQDGGLDSSFNPGLGAGGQGTSGTIANIAVQNDDKIYISGGFFSYYSTNNHVNGLARIMPNGAFDNTFNAGAGVSGDNGMINSLKIEANNRLIIAGSFTKYNTTTIKNIAILNPDGTLDASFNPGLSTDKIIENVLPQPDGKILVSGLFTTYQNKSAPYFIRLNNDGSLDSTFKLDQTIQAIPSAFKLQTDGKIVAAFRNNKIYRLNGDGTIDTTFQINTISNSYSTTLHVNSFEFIGDEIYVIGSFEKFNGVYVNNLVKLKSNGTVDTSFVMYNNLRGEIVNGISEVDGKLIIQGYFVGAKKYIARLMTNGNLDTNFDPGTSTDDYMYALAAQSNNKIIVAGSFTKYNEVQRFAIARINNTVGTPILSAANFTNSQIKMVNPVTDNLIIQSQKKITGIDIFDLGGRLIKSFKTTGGNVSDLGKGVYIVKIKTDNGTITQKIIKE